MEREERMVDVGGLRLHTVLAGPEGGEPLVLLHGFPECWYAWHRLLEPLARAGFRVIAPDMRGYNLSDKPPRVADYRIELLVSDVLGLAAALGHRRFNLAGHNWGAVVGWQVAEAHPERVRRYVAVNSPHMAVMRRELALSPAQALRSWYTYFFQLPWLPELLMASAFTEGAYAAPRAAGALSDGDLAVLRAARMRPGALTGGINYYRALGRRLLAAMLRAGLPGGGRPQPRPHIEPPTLVIWGDDDPFLNRGMADACAAICRDGQVLHIPDVGHWVLYEQPRLVAGAMIDFYRRG